MSEKFEAQVLADLAVLKAQLRELIGNGQPGRIQRIEDRLQLHDAMMQRGKALIIAFLPALGIFHLVLHFAGKH